EAVEVRRDISRNPLFDVMMAVQNNEDVPLKLNGLQITTGVSEYEIAKFDLDINISKIGEVYEVGTAYCTDLYKAETIQWLNCHYREALRRMSENLDAKLEELSLTGEAEYEKLVNEFNDTAADYQKDKTVVELFEEQVKKTPENVAVVFEDTQLSYAELNAKANQLARRLRKLGVRPDDFVAMLTERSLEMIIGIYGILKADGAYVPMDPSYPEERIRYMLNDCKPKAVLTYHAEIKTELPVIDLADSEVWTGAPRNLPHVNQPNDLAYCIYTSGTTGKPKGVMVEHRGLHNLTVAYTKRYELSAKDTVLQAANYIFDQSVWDIFNTLLIGGRLCLISYDDVRNPEKIAKCCRDNQITAAALTPALIAELDPEEFETLRMLESGGEAARETILKKWVQKNRKVFNTYGPTENTVNSSSYLIKGDEGPRIPIGTPASNISFYIQQGEVLCGIGVPGELCIAGDSLARGYLNQPELTAEKFVACPYEDGKMYRTGDLARWLPDGNIEYLGRIDEQVKIRGYRIEIKEIEKAIIKIESVRDCAVIVRTDANGEKALYAYVVSDEEVSISAIRDTLAQTLPEYMIPAYMTQIEKIPVTRNGKLDKRALPEIEGKSER
ncbi:MAG: amino acid adenylation domain-containing protein, partial [Oscillospiraceae bacterium]|nr:amino acid adenylation domain-containing protein [Oscillospiraceae bacterium]